MSNTVFVSAMQKCKALRKEQKYQECCDELCELIKQLDTVKESTTRRGDLMSVWVINENYFSLSLIYVLVLHGHHVMLNHCMYSSWPVICLTYSNSDRVCTCKLWLQIRTSCFGSQWKGWSPVSHGWVWFGYFGVRYGTDLQPAPSSCFLQSRTNPLSNGYDNTIFWQPYWNICVCLIVKSCYI